MCANEEKTLSKDSPIYVLIKYNAVYRWWGRGDVVVNASDFTSEGRWFEAQSLSSCCFRRQETLPHIVALHPGV